MSCPKLLDVIQGDEFVEAGIGVGRNEGSVARYKYEKGNCSSKEVCHDSIIAFFHEQFWRFERIRAADGFGFVFVGNFSGKA